MPKSGPGHFDQTSVGIRQALNAPKSNKPVNEQIRGGSRDIERKCFRFLFLPFQCVRNSKHMIARNYSSNVYHKMKESEKQYLNQVIGIELFHKSNSNRKFKEKLDQKTHIQTIISNVKPDNNICAIYLCCLNQSSTDTIKERLMDRDRE